MLEVRKMTQQLGNIAGGRIALREQESDVESKGIGQVEALWSLRRPVEYYFLHIVKNIKRTKMYSPPPEPVSIMQT